MKDIQILNKKFDRLCFMDNSVEDGLHYYADRLTTRIDTGVYVLEFKSPKYNPNAVHLREGNYITFLNNHNRRIFMNIVQVNDMGGIEKTIYCEDSAIILKNSFAEPMEQPKTGKTIDYYLNYLLEDTGFSIGINEITSQALVGFEQTESILDRIRALMPWYQAQFYFSAELTGNGPKFYINIVKRRLEDAPGFNLSSDNVVNMIERNVDSTNIITRVVVRGAEKTEENTKQKSNVPTVQAPQVSQQTSNIERMIDIAMKQLGKPYVWGANGPSSFDCSGFVSYAFRQSNFPGYPTTGRPTTNSMWDRGGIHANYFNRISRADLRRGDIIMYDTGYTWAGDANHIGIYLGNDKVIHAGNPVQIQNAWSMTVVGYLRVKGA